MKSIKRVDVDIIFAMFKLIDGKLYRKKANGNWKAVKVKLDKYGRIQIKYISDGKSRAILISRLLYILHYGIDIGEGMVIDHIDNDPWNNAKDNLQELNQRDNTSKDVRYNPDIASTVVQFGVTGDDGTYKRFRLGDFADDDVRETVWLSMSPLFLFRQEMKGQQRARNRLIDLVDLGDMDAARALIRAYGVINGIELY